MKTINFNYNFLLVLVMGLFLFSACDPESLDLDGDEIFGVETILDSENCDTECGVTADCEGKSVTITGTIDEINITPSAHQFYIFEIDNRNKQIEIKVDSTVSDDVFAKIADHANKNINIVGTLEGFDAQMNANCERIQFLNLTSADNITLL